MKKYTQAEFDAIPRDEYGIKYCESGDYTEVLEFGGWCSFGADCIFGENCSFEAGRIKNGWYRAVDRIGSQNRKVYFFGCQDGFFVRAGCWFGSIDEFEERVKQVHSGTRHEVDYLDACVFMRKLLMRDMEERKNEQKRL